MAVANPDGRSLMASWPYPPDSPQLSAGEVHVWQVSLDASPLLPILSPDEQERANRFHFERDRQRFVAGRSWLRTILSGYLAVPADQLQFVYSPRGKPTLVAGEIQFNVSHSQGLALYAVRYDRPIGVDLECVRPIEVMSLARRFFSPREAAILQTLPPEEQLVAFFRAWTQKEAYLKATGEGLAGLQHVEISLADDEPGILSAEGRSATSSWFVQELEPDVGYVGAIASPVEVTTVRYWQVSMDA
jgi:4'-phosphopantetheinyl transferase